MFLCLYQDSDSDSLPDPGLVSLSLFLLCWVVWGVCCTSLIKTPFTNVELKSSVLYFMKYHRCLTTGNAHVWRSRELYQWGSHILQVHRMKSSWTKLYHCLKPRPPQQLQKNQMSKIIYLPIQFLMAIYEVNCDLFTSVVTCLSYFAILPR